MAGIQQKRRQFLGAGGEFGVRTSEPANAPPSFNKTTNNTPQRGAIDLLQEYYKRQGGKPTVPKGGAKKRGRQSQDANTPEAAKKLKKGRPSQSATTAMTGSHWAPPKGSWEDQVQTVDTIEQDDKGALHVYLLWNDGTKSKHSIERCYDKCPRTVRSQSIPWLQGR